ncbi:cysteine desulfurase [Candidatus Woesearchaeota archaeon]|nr:cysteine desulfurase [Candidatus Woesearchaeota archaeon]
MKSLFPLLEKNKKLIYLDSSATTQKPKEVLDALQKFYEESNANVHRGAYSLAQKATVEYETAREIIAEFIGAQKEEIIFTRGTTESLNLLASSLGKKLVAGDEILLTEMEHHSNLVPWQQLAKEKNLLLKFIPVTSEGILDMREVKKLISKRTKIVSVTHISNVLGTINPIKELAVLAHAAGALCIVDAAQSVSHLPINVRELGCDFLAFSGHKMYGPTGIGVLWGKKELLEEMEPVQYGGDMISEVTFKDARWNEVPWKFEAGTPNIAGVMGLAAAVLFLQKNFKEIQGHEKELTEYALEKISTISELKILGPRILSSGSHILSRGPLVAFTMNGIHPHDVAEICNRYTIAVRGGYHCAMPLHQKLGIPGSVRASFAFHNSKKDIDTLVKALQKAQEVIR